MGEILIRDARADDFNRISEIYAPNVLEGLATFETEPPTPEEMQGRWQTLIEKEYPYLVAETDDQIAGYCYAGPYRPRAAYKHTAENSVYMDPNFQGQGIASKLMIALEERLRPMGIRSMVAIIGNSQNHGSIALHRACGFDMVGTLKEVGFKNGQWVDTVLMQKMLSR